MRETIMTWRLRKGNEDGRKGILPASGRVITTLLLIFFLMPTATIYSIDQIDKKKRELSLYEKKLQEKREALKKATSRKKGVTEDLNQIEERLAEGGKRIAVLKESLRRTEANVDLVKKDLVLISQELKERQEILSQRVRAIHKYRSYEGINIFFDADNFAHLAKRFYFMCLIAQADTDLIKRIKYQKALIANKKDILQREHQTIDRIKCSEQFILNKQAREARQRREILIRIDNEEALYIKQIKKLENDSNQLASLIKRLEAQKRLSYQKPRSGISYEGQGTLPWPVKGGTVLRGFGKYRHPKFNVIINNKGIDIQTQQGQIVSSIKEGEVVFANWFKGYGMLVMIDHGGGLYSLYGQLSDILTTTGERVLTGTPIGRVGNTDSTQSPNLHFEIRLNEKPVDPLAWLRRR